MSWKQLALHGSGLEAFLTHNTSRMSSVSHGSESRAHICGFHHDTQDDGHPQIRRPNLQPVYITLFGTGQGESLQE